MNGKWENYVGSRIPCNAPLCRTDRVAGMLMLWLQQN